MNFVTQQLAIGSSRVTFWQLKRARITHVINVRHKRDRFQVRDRGLIYHHNPTPDDGQPKSPEYWRETIRFALEALQVPKARIYVHCKAGVNRGPAHVYAILRALGYGPEEAWSLIVRARPKCMPRYVADVEAVIQNSEPW